MTYDKVTFDIPAYQEGNLQDFEFDMDEEFPLSSISDITFQVRSFLGYEVMSKKLSTGSIAVDGQRVTIPFTPYDTKNKCGVHNYEIDFKNDAGEPIFTMGGKFTVNKEINTL